MKRGDIAVALCLLAIAGGLFLARRTGEGAVFINGTKAEASAQVNNVTIELERSRARVAASPCRDQRCVRAGWLERPGDVAVCLPQRVLVEIRAEHHGVDSVAY